ncbi:MAG: DUF4258 domain-containing protein [Actinomycetota bacterium]|nr:DUF4258 domain-containing protein [Actinomycetota bacterium]
MVKVEFTDHALYKIRLLRAHGFEITETSIAEIINYPDNIEEGFEGRLIAQKVIDAQHVLRVVFETTQNKVLVITLYPGRRIRYEKNKI